MPKEQNPLKKARRGEDNLQPEDESIGSESEASGRSSRRSSRHSSDQEPFLANDMIDLIFIEPDEKEFLVAAPQFTHQLFDEKDRLEEVTFMEAPEECRVSIHIRCADLKHMIGVPSGSNAIEQQQLLGCLKKALPAHAEVFLLHGKNAGDDNEDEQEEDQAYFDRLEKFAVETPERGRTKAGQNSSAECAAPGKLVHSFIQDGDNFEIYLASARDAGASELLHRAERIAMWFIETADSIDFSDERWQVLFLYRRCRQYIDAAGRKKTGEILSLAGYFTLFTFHNPFAGSKLRVCQALIFPHLQGRGLGRELLLYTYKMAYQDESISEITVEDPAPGFQSLRDSVDLEWLYQHNGHTRRMTSAALKHDDAEMVARKLKLTMLQGEYLAEIEQYAALLEQAEALGGSDSESGSKMLEETLKPLRLLVKRRLLRQFPDMKTLPKAKMQKELDTLYAEQQVRFEAGRKTRKRLFAISSQKPLDAEPRRANLYSAASQSPSPSKVPISDKTSLSKEKTYKAQVELDRQCVIKMKLSSPSKSV
jgi:hypothetical protein